MNKQRAFTPSPEQIAKWRKKFESRYDLSQLGTIYERYLDLAVREAWGNYVEAREDALAEQATTIVDDHRVAEAINNLTEIAKDFSTHQSLRIRLSGVVIDLAQGLIREKTEQATEIAALKAKIQELLDQPEGEPVAELLLSRSGHWIVVEWHKTMPVGTKLYTHPAPSKE
jgi:hypothetical protein